MSQIQIVKRKLRGFFSPNEVTTIQQAVLDCHKILSNASILLRAFCIDWYDKNGFETCLTLEHFHVSFACNIVQGVRKPPIRGGESTTNNEKIKTFIHILDVYDNIYDSKDCITTEYSLSHILAYSIDNLLTAFENNITNHFPKYPKRFIKCKLLSMGFNLYTSKRVATIITNHYLYDMPLDALDGIEDLQQVKIHVKAFQHLFIDKQTKKEQSRAWDLKVNPWLYLSKMVQINKALETDFANVSDDNKRLYNPLPFHSSFVPMHVRIDTSGLCQLLMDKNKIKEFKEYYEINNPGVEVNMRSKADMLSSFEKLTGKKDCTKEETGLFATSLWEFLTNLRTCRQRNDIYNTFKGVDWVFDNAIITDGVSVSFQVINKEQFGRKTLSGRKPKVSKESPKVQEPYKVLEHEKVLSCDPGKHDLMAVTDGSKTITYTRGQRNQDTFEKERKQQTLKRKRQSGMEDYESNVLNKYCKRSCHFDTFKGYCQARKAREDELIALYSHPIFRQFKFTQHCKVKSSESKFSTRIFNTFKDGMVKKRRCMDNKMLYNASKTVRSQKEIVIVWGDWGKAPNTIKGLQPTPGIGLRKSMEKWYKTITVNENLTSQRCPCCQGGRCLKKAVMNNTEVHHLLRCTNDNCKSRWWNRNVVGSFNIIFRSLNPDILFEEPSLKKRKTKKSC